MYTYNKPRSGNGNLFVLFLFTILIVIGIYLWNNLLVPVINSGQRLLNDNTSLTSSEESIVMTNLYMAVNSQASGHGLIKHGSDAELVHQCINNNGVLNTFRNPSNGKKVNIVCIQLENNIQWGVQFLNKIDREITAFIKDPQRYKTLEDIIRYVTTSGYNELLK